MYRRALSTPSFSIREVIFFNYICFFHPFSRLRYNRDTFGIGILFLYLLFPFSVKSEITGSVVFLVKPTVFHRFMRI